MTLSKQIIRSGVWLQISKLLQLGTNIVASAILARLLTPGIFGLAGIVTLYATFVGQFTMLGLSLGIIQKKEITQRQLSSTFWINLTFGLFSTLLVAFTSPLAASYYHQKDLIPLILLHSTNFIIAPFYQIHRRLLEKQILFNKIAKIEVLASAGSGFFAILFALLGFGVYSIVWQTLSMNLIYLISTRLSIKWKPDFTFSFQEVKDLIFFSLKMKGARLLNFLERNIDFMILSKIFNTTWFGYYSLAYRILYFPVRRVVYVFEEILFPAFSSIQENIDKIRNGYLKSIQLVAMAILPISVILSLFSKQIVIFIIGKKWLPIANIIFILSFAGFFQSLAATGDAIFPALNRPQVLLKLEGIRTLMIGLAVFIGGSRGIFEVSVALLITNALLFMLSLIILKKLIFFRYAEILKKLFGPLLASFGMFVILLNFSSNKIRSPFHLVLVLALGCLAYILINFLVSSKDISYIISRLR